MRSLLLFLAFLLPAALHHANAGNAEIRVRDDATGRTVARLEAFTYLPSGKGPFPVLVLSHGSAGGSPKASISWKRDGRHWAKQGYLVVAPMRQGRGKSSGISPESEEKDCDVEHWHDALPLSFADLDATIEYTRSLPLARQDGVTLIGVSRGGFLSVAYAAEGKHRSRVRAVVNFVGGWTAQAEDQCPVDFNLAAFARYGANAKAPMIWLYGARDLFYGDDAVHQYVDAFSHAGGNLEFHFFPGVPENGHWLPSYPARWQSVVDAFLRANNAP
ncbi:dienelactone hydrolase family protein [Rivibacter subsaxonicus]|uniref:Dienelactone hydrolase n=1 Tax=Rivibacter subsaxonicus TaxID=457575 RepID=A0A4Q7VZC4_9BURK|nr:alpha/beta fold hydrolase [Rivibacter subsaxonicus]RZU02214.1 dienelactone hydrolase [Rivibacter subsaxonicus]